MFENGKACARKQAAGSDRTEEDRVSVHRRAAHDHPGGGIVGIVLNQREYSSGFQYAPHFSGQGVPVVERYMVVDTYSGYQVEPCIFEWNVRGRYLETNVNPGFTYPSALQHFLRKITTGSLREIAAQKFEKLTPSATNVEHCERFGIGRVPSIEIADQIAFPNMEKLAIGADKSIADGVAQQLVVPIGECVEFGFCPTHSRSPMARAMPLAEPASHWMLNVCETKYKGRAFDCS